MITNKIISIILSLSLLLSSLPYACAESNSTGNLVYCEGTVEIYEQTNADGSITLTQYNDGILFESATCIPGEADSTVIVSYESGNPFTRAVENPFTNLSISPQSRAIRVSRLGVITYNYSTDSSAGTCRAEVSYSYNTIPVQTTFMFTPIEYEIYSIAALASFLMSLCSLFTILVAREFANAVGAAFGVLVGAAGYRFSTTGIPLGALMTEYTFDLVNVDKATHRNTITTKHYVINDESKDVTISEYWDNHVPTKCWKTYSFGAAVMAALWQYDIFSIESWTYQ